MYVHCILGNLRYAVDPDGELGAVVDLVNCITTRHGVDRLDLLSIPTDTFEAFTVLHYSVIFTPNPV